MSTDKKTFALAPLQKKTIRFGIKGLTSIILHQWAEKSKKQMRDKKAGQRVKTREVCDPDEEVRMATYLDSHGQPGFPGLAFKASLLTAAHKDITGIPRTTVSKAVFLQLPDDTGVIPFQSFKEVVVREDPVRVGNGSSADLRYRPEFRGWTAIVKLDIDEGILQVEDVFNLVNRAGFGVGICEWRPEKGGEFGRFEVDTSVPVTFPDPDAVTIEAPPKANGRRKGNKSRV